MTKNTYKVHTYNIQLFGLASIIYETEVVALDKATAIEFAKFRAGNYAGQFEITAHDLTKTRRVICHEVKTENDGSAR